jgi:TPR repeat protein
MDTHHELSGYLFCRDTARIAQALREQLEAEGMALVDSAEGRGGEISSEDGRAWRIAVIPGRGGWHVLLATPDAWLCEAGPNGAIRFAALSRALGAPGFLREAWYMEDFIGMQGTVNLLVDGHGRQCIAGQLYDYEADAPSVEAVPRWRGHAIEHGEGHEDAELWPVIRASFPDSPPSEPGRHEPELDETKTGLDLIERLGGQGLSTYWLAHGEAWRRLKAYLAQGEVVPLAGAVTLTFRRPVSGGTRPAQASAESDAQVSFRYANGNDIRIGDRVRLKSGADGEVVDVLGTFRREGGRPRYAVVRTARRHRMIKATRVKRGDYRFVDIARLQAAAVPGDKPAIDALERLAGAGDADAMAQLGFIHYVGDGRPRDPARSCHWLAAAAEHGHPDAAYQLARHVRTEFGVVYDRDKIRALAEAAYRHGSVEAAQILIDHAQEDARLELLQRLAAEGNPIGQCKLAYRVQAGRGVEHDLEEAARLLERSARQGCAEAQQQLGWYYSMGIGVGRDSRLAAYWYRRAIDQGRDAACIAMAQLYLEGSGIMRDTACAIALLEYARDENLPGAREALNAALKWL